MEIGRWNTARGGYPQCSPSFEKAVLSLDLFQMSNTARLTSIHAGHGLWLTLMTMFYCVYCSGC